MIFDFSQKSSLLLIFFTHGLIFSILLFVQGFRHARKSSSWLGLFVLLCCFYISPFMLGYAGWYGINGYRETLFYLPLQQLLLIGPVMYFYVKSLLYADFELKKKDYIHFLPGFAYLLYSLIIFIADIFVLNELYFYANGKDKDLDSWYQVTGFISMFFYVALSLRYYQQYKRFAFQVVSFAESVLYRWVQRYLTALLVILVLRIIFFAVNPEWGEFGNKFWYYISFSILFYYISITGYSNAVKMISALSATSSQSENITSIHSLQQINAESEILTTDDRLSSQKIPDLEQWTEKLENLMQTTKLYTNTNLTLMHLSEALHTTPKHISQVVNQGFNINFNDYINHHRTRAVIEKFKAKEHRYKTLLALALECGFNSKSTFNRAFKKQTGMTPKDYLEKLP
jgi:AraC-like DNA-binding protein